MKLLRILMIISATILSVTLLLVVDFAGLHPASILSSTAYSPLIGKINFGNYADLYMSAFNLSGILLVIMTILVRRVYSIRRERLTPLAIPLLIAIFIHYLLDNKIDEYLFWDHDPLGFLRMFFINLPGFFTVYIPTGLLLFLGIMITCYPIGILADKLLLYIARRVKGKTA